MKKNTRRRMKPSFGYRGAILNHSNSYTFNRRVPFSKLKEIYGEELDRFELESPAPSLPSKELLAHKRKEIKDRVRKQLKKERKHNIMIISFVSVLVLVFLFLINNYFSNVVEFLNV